MSTRISILSLFLYLLLIPKVHAEISIDQAKLERDSLNTLVDLIKMDTSQPAGNEYLAVNYLAKRLANEGIAYKIFESIPGRANLVARVKGNGSKKPLLLLAHTDVVTVERENWTFDPFMGEVKNGKIFGRGASDDKSVVATNFEILLALKRNKTALDRDVIFLAVADEEGGGGLGITFMIENHLKEIDAEFAINEGGQGLIDATSNQYTGFIVGTAEKTPRRALLTVKGRAGHGSVPTTDNVIVILSQAISNLYTSPLPVRLNETTRTFFTRIATISPPNEKKIIKEILNGDPSMKSQLALQKLNPSYYSFIRTSVVPTIINSGYQRNVIPSEAEATLDIRALPGEDPEYLFERLANIIDDDRVKITPMKVTRPAHDPSPLNTALFSAFETVLSNEHPNAVVLPYMSTGATDSAQLRAVGIPSYGFGPGMVSGENNGIHGNDEFLRIEPFYEYTRLMWLIVTSVAAS
ncbi:MAG: acetylornithine deacetylase/succinyl-diaminopimelate desuccinylase-like protein [Candidatus Azotimanducaceae bacterium]|jgi:acetylornithine deacetylase/succinyl-diaminopimelate desuccinylase-like protein